MNEWSIFCIVIMLLQEIILSVYREAVREDKPSWCLSQHMAN